jgi:hypothetical protein
MTEKLVICPCKEECGVVVCPHNHHHTEKPTCEITSKLHNHCVHCSSCHDVEEPAPFVPSRILNILDVRMTVRTCWECPMHLITYNYDKYPCDVHTCALDEIEEFRDRARAEGYLGIVTSNAADYDGLKYTVEPGQAPFHVTCPLPEEGEPHV